MGRVEATVRGTALFAAFAFWIGVETVADEVSVRTRRLHDTAVERANAAEARLEHVTGMAEVG